MSKTIDEHISEYAQFILKSDGGDDYAGERRKLKQAIEDTLRQARIEGILEGFKMSGEGWNGEYPYGDRGASDEEILSDILPDELKRIAELEEHDKEN